VFLTQHRSWVRKGLEAWYTVWLELLVPKERILEVYLNVAELGPMVFGVEAAALYWFKHPASQLRAGEAASLAAMLPSPNRWTPKTPRVKRRAAWIQSAPITLPRDIGGRGQK
jgi:monofunctional biosynthetic peptidoglycan transglycosylase